LPILALRVKKNYETFNIVNEKSKEQEEEEEVVSIDSK